MKNVRLVANVSQNNGTFTIVNVKVVVDNPATQSTASRLVTLNTEVGTVGDVFNTIQTAVVDLLQSGLI